jgi:ribosomal protein L24
MNKLRKGDQVIVLTGRDKGKRGTVTSRVDDERIVVERVLESKTTRAGKRYLVVPQGSGPNDQLWVRAMDVANPEILQ